MKLLRTHPFFIKLLNREYWPMWATYFPVFFYYLYLSLRARSFFWFSATNPSIETGGMLGESKINILNRIPKEYKPVSLFIPKQMPFEKVQKLMEAERIDFPMVMKPDIGERGLLVEKIGTKEALKHYFNKNDIDFIIQPFVEYKVELAIMYYLVPNENRAKVFSVCKKQFLGFKGDGISTLRQLIMNDSRAILQLDKLEKRFADKMDTIIPKDERLELEPIGNHSRGTMFLDARDIIDEQLEKVVYHIGKQVEGVYFGRFDLRTRSIEDLKQGKHIAILEINGVGAEPAHIYDPQYSLWNTWKDLLRQWSIMFKVAKHNHKTLGIPYMSLKEAKERWKVLKEYRANLN